MPLSAISVSKLTKPGRYPDGGSLYLQVTPSGTKSWLLRYERYGRERAMGLGPVDRVTLKQARVAAFEARKLIDTGADPIDTRKAAREAKRTVPDKTITFQQAAQQYFEQHGDKWRNAKHRAQFLSTLRDYAFQHIGKLPVDKVDTTSVLRCLDPIWSIKPETANRVRGRIENVLDFATVRGYRTGDNPARWKGYLANVLPAREQLQKVVHHAALPGSTHPRSKTSAKTCG